MSFLEMCVILAEGNWAYRTSKGPSRCNFDWWLPRDMRHQEIHGNIFTVHVLIDFVSYGLRQSVSVKVSVVLVEKSGARQHHTQLTAVV